MTVPTPPLLGDWQPLPAADPAVDAARAEADALLAEANRMYKRAQDDAARITADARRDAAVVRAEADHAREEAQTAIDRKTKRAARVDEWGPRIALFAAIALTASGELALAQLAGWPAWIAWALPVAIDVYVVQAFRRHRDVSGAIILMIAANALYHLAERGLFGVATRGGEIVRNAHGEPLLEWWLVVGVAAIAPIVMWRIHRITAPKGERRERAHAPEHPQVSAEPERPSEHPEPDVSALTERPPERAHERPAKPKGERRERAHRAPKKSAKKSDSERRRERVRALYDELGRRPEWTEIRDALVSANVAPADISRSSVQRLRDAVEKHEPALAALGSANIRTLKTGS